MTESAQETCAPVERLAQALDALGDALASGDLEGILAAAPRLAGLATTLATIPAPRSTHDDLRRAALDARLALRRCQRLGAGLHGFIECSLAAQGRRTQYERHGLAHAPIAGHALIARG